MAEKLPFLIAGSSKISENIRRQIFMINRYFDLSVLYVEDDRISRERCGAMLSRHVREVRTAEDGSVGLALFMAKKPDIVITDIRMPVMSGLEMAKKMKETDRSVHVIVTTAFNDLEYMMEAIEIGVDSFIMKPVDVEKLIQAIGKCEELIMLRKTIQVRDEEQRILIAELQKALDEVNTLKGMLPICSSCKRIRDDRGYWNAVDAYITEHSEAIFTHSMCPDCIRTLYPDLNIREIKENKKTKALPPKKI
jgi:YesN/AraC family two-component response regulator